MNRCPKSECCIKCQFGDSSEIKKLYFCLLWFLWNVVNLRCCQVTQEPLRSLRGLDCNFRDKTGVKYWGRSYYHHTCIIMIYVELSDLDSGQPFIKSLSLQIFKNSWEYLPRGYWPMLQCILKKISLFFAKSKFLGFVPSFVVPNHPSQARQVCSHSRSQIDLEKTIALFGKKFHRKISFSVV